MRYSHPEQRYFPPVAGQTLHTDCEGGALSSDFGALLLRGIDRQIGLTERLSAAIHDKRHPSSIDHPLRDLLAQRISQLASGYADANPAGRMLMQMVGSFAEFERAMIRERTQAGLAAARARGRIGGRRPKLGPQQQAVIVAMVHTGQQSQADAARLFRVHPATVSRLLATHHQQGAQDRSPREDA